MAVFDDGQNPLLGDRPESWGALIEAVGPASILVVIESRMSARLKSHLSPEDIWQEALLQAWRDRARFEWRGLRSFRSWLLTIIDHRIRDAAMNQDAQKRGGGQSAIMGSNLRLDDPTASASSDLPVPIATTTPSRIAIHREQAAAMSAALAALPDELREVVRLRLFEQLTLEQVAERLGTTLAAVRYRFGRGAETFRRRLREHMTSRSGYAAPESTTDPAPESAS